MRKIAIIGAGSIVFCKTLILDIMATEGLEDTRFALMAPTTGKTSMVEDFANKVIKRNGLSSEVYVTTDRREALECADYVISTFQIGGVSAFEKDYKIPKKYGVDQCIGDTLGPGGVFRALRSIPVTLDMAKDMSADLIVVSSGRDDLKDFLLGPNAARIVRHADCSVLVVRN